MNCPSRTDDTDGREGWNQSPNLLAGATRADFNGRTNATARRTLDPDVLGEDVLIAQCNVDTPPPPPEKRGVVPAVIGKPGEDSHVTTGGWRDDGSGGKGKGGSGRLRFYKKAGKVFMKFASFIGPGFMVRASSVATSAAKHSADSRRRYRWLTSTRVTTRRRWRPARATSFGCCSWCCWRISLRYSCSRCALSWGLCRGWTSRRCVARIYRGGSICFFTFWLRLL